MRKKGLILLIVMMIISVNTVFAAGIYPEYSVDNKNDVTVTQRINIVYDNTDHGYVKNIVSSIFTVAAIEETSDVWIYPIAGSQAPIKIEPTKEFMEKYYTLFAKPSNEMKAEDVLSTAFNELKNDTSGVAKKFVYFCNYETYEIHPQYNMRNIGTMAQENPDIIFWPFNHYGTSVHYTNVSTGGKPDNVELLDDKNFISMTLSKTGYSSCDVTYDENKSELIIPKAAADKNILVIAQNMYNQQEYPCISGYMTDLETYEKYKGKNKIKGVALSYNHMCMDAGENQGTNVIALFTADGTHLNPLEEDMYIPIKNADNVAVYYRSAAGAGVCSADTEYDNTQEAAVKYVEEPEEQSKNASSIETERLTVGGFASREGAYAEEPTGVKKVFNTVWNVIKGILAFIWAIIQLAFFAFIILLIVHKKFRNIVHIKLLESRFGPMFEKAFTAVSKYIKSFVNTVTEIKGTANLEDKFVFISHSSKDINVPNNRIETVVRELEKKGVNCWLAENNIKPGQDYNAVLPEAIRKCSLFILFISPNAVKSDEVVTEISTAKEYHKMIVPIQITPFDLFGQFDSWKYMLKQYQKTDLFSNKKEEVDALIEYIVNIYNQ